MKTNRSLQQSINAEKTIEKQQIELIRRVKEKYPEVTVSTIHEDLIFEVPKEKQNLQKLPIRISDLQEKLTKI